MDQIIIGVKGEEGKEDKSYVEDIKEEGKEELKEKGDDETIENEENKSEVKSHETEKIKLGYSSIENLDIEANKNKSKNERNFSINLIGEIVKKSIFKFLLKSFCAVMLILLYLIFFIYALKSTSGLDESNYWCDGDGFLIINTAFFGSLLMYFQVIKPYIFGYFLIHFRIPIQKVKLLSNRRIKLILYLILSASFLSFLLSDTENFSRFTSVFGVFVFLLIAVAFSKLRSKIRVEQIFWGLTVQVTFALLILRWSFGKQIFQCLGVKVSNFLSFTDYGTRFAPGEFLDGTFSFTFKILPAILFLGMFTSILFHYGILQWIIVKLGWILQIFLGTTPCESMAAVANIFLGMSEAPLVVKPYIPLLTKSEIHAIMTGGFATMAGSVLAALTYFGVDAAHLLSASIISAPAALTMSKVFYPETEIPQENYEDIKIIKRNDRNVIEAIMTDLKSNTKLIAIIAANLIVFVGGASLLNSLTNWSCELLGYEEGYCQHQNFFGYVFYPLAWLMGVPSKECHFVGYLLGMKVIVTEILAYKELGEKIKQGVVSARAAAIATYALCGFSSLPAMTAAAGALTVMAPSRIKDFSQLVLRAFVAGNFASFLTACVAGILIDDPVTRISIFEVNATNLSSN